MKIGQYIRRLRVAHKLTQKQMARMIGAEASIYSRYESDSVTPSIYTLMEIAKVFGITLDELCGFVPDTGKKLSDQELSLARLREMGISVARESDMVGMNIYGKVYSVNIRDLSLLVERTDRQYEKMLVDVNKSMYGAAIVLTLNSGNFTFTFDPGKELDAIINKVYFWCEEHRSDLTRDGLASLIREEFLLLPSPERTKAWKQILDGLVGWNVIDPEDCDKEEWQCPFIGFDE